MRASGILVTLLTAGAVVALALDNGTFALTARGPVAIAVWWTIGLVVALGLWTAARAPASALCTGALLTGFTLWTGASVAWAPSAERAFTEFNRAALYLGVFLLATMAAGAGRVRWSDGLGLGIATVGLLALASRFFPGIFPEAELQEYATGPQLTYPLEYANGLAIFVGLAFPLLLRAAIGARTAVWRGLAVTPLPALAAVLYLTSSRGGVLVAATGALLFLALTSERWTAAGAILTAGAGSAVAMAVLFDRTELVDAPLTRAAENQGPSAALLIGLACAGTGAIFGVGCRLLGRLPRPSPALGWATVVLVVLLGLTSAAAAQPLERLREFKRSPALTQEQYTVRGHLVSVNSTGRWQYWKAAYEQFEREPLRGQGAGSYEAWWARHGTIALFITDAHSLYLETLGELGAIGLGLLVTALGLGLVCGIVRARRSRPEDRPTAAALTACFLAYVLGAGIDWMWELTVVTLIGVASLGLVLGGQAVPRRRAWPSRVARFTVPAAALLYVVCQAIPLLAQLELRDSQAAVSRADAGAALAHAERARELQPWAASPHLQLALVEEERARLHSARAWIRAAIARDRSDWRLWLVRARLDTKAGAIDAARRSLHQATELNLLGLATAITFLMPGPARSSGPLETAVFNPSSELGVQRIRAAGASTVFIWLYWRDVAPTNRSPEFNPDDPFDPAYRWEQFDEALRSVVGQGLRPLVNVYGAPQWAEGEGRRPRAAYPGTRRPDPAEYARFAKAAATRYSGLFPGLPRVRYWQAWAEQNLFFHLSPQFVRERPVAPIWYRGMLNAFSDAVHSVDPTNVVITGGLAPFSSLRGERRHWGIGPLRFMRIMLCMSKELKPTCKRRSRFDIWAHHPYTSGGPNHQASLPEDVSLGDLPEMRRLLDAAVRAGHVSSRQKMRFWVTEFSWDTSPPDPKGVPARLHARWVAEALYRMWSAGVSLVTWLQLRDDPFPGSYFQGGLYFRGPTLKQDRPKPALRAFEFPFVALPERGRVVAWGRTPTSRPGSIFLERRSAGGWVRMMRVRANRYGIFNAVLPQTTQGRNVRARVAVGGETSLAFRVVKTRDRPAFAFGTLPG